MDGQEIVINEILCYIDGKIKTTPTDTLKSIILSYYDSDAIEQAKFSLYAAIPRNFTTEAALEMSHEDDLSAIITIMQMIKPEDKPMIVCKDLNNVPSSDNIVKPDPDGPMPVVMKKEQRVMKNQLRQMHNDVLSLKDGICLLVDSSEDPDVEFEDKENFTEYATPTARVRKKPRKKKAEAIYVNKTETLDGVEESIMLQADGLPSPIKKYTNNNGQNVTICHDEEGVVMTMVADDDLMQTGDQLSDAANIEVVEGKPSKRAPATSENDFYIKVRSIFHEKLGTMECYQCSSCSYETNELDAIKQHQCIQDYMKCHMCDELVEDVFQLNQHFLKHNNVTQKGNKRKEFECSLCFNETDSFKDHLDHLDLHSWKRPYRCLFCSTYKTTTERALRKHHIKHMETVPNGFKCLMCHKICGTRSALNKHATVHKRSLDYRCNICNLTYAHQSALTQHQSWHDRDAKSHFCDICGLSFANQHSLNVHVKGHQKRQFPCDVCHMVFNTGELKRRHMAKLHPDAQPFTCDVCGTSFKYQRKLFIHKKKHKKSTKSSKSCNACHHCQEKFRSKKQLKEHIALAHYDTEEAPSQVQGIQVHYDLGSLQNMDSVVSSLDDAKLSFTVVSTNQTELNPVIIEDEPLTLENMPTMDDAKKIVAGMVKRYANESNAEPEVSSSIEYQELDTSMEQYIEEEVSSPEDFMFGLENGLEIM